MNVREFNWDNERLSQMNFINQVDFLVVHHSDSGDVSAQEIDRWHRAKSYVGIGYHYAIRADGSIEKGRPDNKMGAHAYGFNNQSLGIVLAGDFSDTVPTTAQMDSLVELLKELQAQHGAVQVIRHRDLMATSCPGNAFPWEELLHRLERGNEPMPGKPAPDQWKLDLIERAKQAGLITSDHDPEEPVTFWALLAVCLNLLKAVKG